MANPYPITAHDVLEAIKQGAREGTAQAMADMFETGSAKVQLTGSNVPMDEGIPVLGVAHVDIVTLVDAASVQPNGGEVTFGINSNSAKEFWLLVAIDKSPWDLQMGKPWQTTLYNEDTVYPRYFNHQNTYTLGTPAVAFYMGMQIHALTGLEYPTSIEEARAYAIPPVAGIGGRIRNNHPNEVATVTVRLVRVWR